MKKRGLSLSKRDKILIVLYEMSQVKHSAFKYEDVIVTLFKKHPEDFHLRGYPEYPDSSNQSFYTLRKNGLIQVRNKFVKLTEKGVTSVKQILKIQPSLSQKQSKRLSRDIIQEIDRIKNTDVFQLFGKDNKDQIVDSDFFTYLGVTVRTERTDFEARIKTIKDVIDNIKKYDEYKTVIDLHNYLFEKYKELIKTKLSIGYPRRNIS